MVLISPLLFNGSVVELVDALDSKSSARKGVGVRFSPEPPFVKVFEHLSLRYFSSGFDLFLALKFKIDATFRKLAK